MPAGALDASRVRRTGDARPAPAARALDGGDVEPERKSCAETLAK
jgi:hypothetical protein